MSRPIPGVAGLLLIALSLSGCLGRSSTGAAAPPSREVITRETILEHHFNNAYEAVEALHSNWLTPRGPDSFSTPSEVVVYYDATRMGGVETLRSITPAMIAYIQWFDGNAATMRWGVGHSQGAIFVSSRR